MTDKPNDPNNPNPADGELTAEDMAQIARDLAAQQIADHAAALDEASDMDAALLIFDELLALGQKLADRDVADSDVMYAVRLFYAGAARVLHHFDALLTELVEQQRTTNALLLASAPNKVTMALRDRYENTRKDVAADGTDPDEVPSPDDQFQAAIDHVEIFALDLSADTDESDEDADDDDPPTPRKVEG